MLIAENLSKTYGDYKALNNLNLKLNKGEIFALLGQNGAGKSTTINIFLGFVKPTKGAAKINGISVIDYPEETKKFIAYIPETVLLYPNLTGVENLKFFSSLAGFDYDNEVLTGFLSKAGLQSDAHHNRLGGYSKGMRQKVGIAIAIAKKAKVLLLDEPTSNLDVLNEGIILKSLSEESAGKTIVLVSHRKSTMSLADKTYEMAKGRFS